MWPSSRLLCAYIWEHRPSFRDARVVELGAGLPLPCVAALQAGARSVLATDVAYRDEHVARACRELAGDNRVPRDALRIRSLEWGQPEDVDSTGALGPFDWVLGADVLYDPKRALPHRARALRPAARHPITQRPWLQSTTRS